MNDASHSAVLSPVTENILHTHRAIQ